MTALFMHHGQLEKLVNEALKHINHMVMDTGEVRFDVATNQALYMVATTFSKHHAAT